MDRNESPIDPFTESENVTLGWSTQASSSQTQLVSQSQSTIANKISTNKLLLEESFKPTYLFFYGSLMIPQTLIRLLDLTATPSLFPAKIQNYEIKLWGPFPALLPSENTIVEGAVYQVQSKNHLIKLCAYESCNYRLENVDINVQRLNDQEEEEVEVIQGKTFVWNGYEEELENGEWDLNKYRREYVGSN